MTEATIIQSLIQQVPSAAAVIVVVIVFLRSLEARDKLFYDQMAKLTDRINSMENALVSHDVKMDEALLAMHRAKTTTKPKRKAK